MGFYIQERKGVWSSQPWMLKEPFIVVFKSLEDRELPIPVGFAAHTGPVSSLFHRVACWEL